jgi:hypothetical protein
MKRRALILFIYLGLLGSSIGSFYFALRYFDTGLMYMAVGSTNPHPTAGIEYVRAMNRSYMMKAQICFGLGLIFLAAIIVAVMVVRRYGKRDSKLQSAKSLDA